MTPTPHDYLRASTHLQQAHDNALIEFSTASLVGQISSVYREQCLKRLAMAALALNFKLVPTIPQPVPAMDAPTQEASHEVIAFPISEKKAGAALSNGAGRSDKEPA